jgi:hypothetical protein
MTRSYGLAPVPPGARKGAGFDPTSEESRPVLPVGRPAINAPAAVQPVPEQPADYSCWIIEEAEEPLRYL